MTYVDGFIARSLPPIAKSYKNHAEIAAAVFQASTDALKLVECWGDDVPDGKITSFSDGGQMPGG